ncbi:MAG: amidase [Acidimicrobiales bacterium]
MSLPDAADALGAFVDGPRLVARGAPSGRLAGVKFAVKDLIDVAGLRTGAGNPGFLARSVPAPAHAPAVAALLADGAQLWGKTVTDELAFSLSGTNVHYGTPRNVAAPGRIPGGSSSGSAAAVAAGVVEVALGTDTGGSVRVPASYCGIYGLRPSHGRVSVSGVVPLAPRFDVVGVLAARPQVLDASARALLAHAPGSGTGADAGERRSVASLRRIVLPRDLWALADSETVASLSRRVARLASDLGGLEVVEVDLAGEGGIELWGQAFRVLQLSEAWKSHGAFVEREHPCFGPGVADRFAAAACVSEADVAEAEPVAARARERVGDVLGQDAICCQSVAMGPAPGATPDGSAKAELRSRTLWLGAPAALAGAPVLVLPGARASGLPVGLGVVGKPCDDEILLDVLRGVGA